MLVPPCTSAMQVLVSGAVVTLSGPVVLGDGGHAPTGYQIGELVRFRGLMKAQANHLA